MTSQEIFDKLMKYRDESIRGNKTLDEYFDAIMYSVAKVLDLTDEQAHQLAGEEMESAPVAVPTIELNPAEYEITDGYVGSLGKTYTKATAETLDEAIGAAMERNGKSYNEIAAHLLAGGPVEWCESPNYYYDHSLGFIRRKRNLPRVQLTECACGHSVPQTQVMTTSSGTSCPDCYDRMSN